MADAVRLQLPSGEWFTIDAADAEKVASVTGWRLWSRKDRPGKLYVYRTYKERVDGKLRQRSVFLHRFLAGAAADVLVDHRNGDGLDNRRENLRETDHRGNSTNVVHSKRQKLGGFKGVTWNKTAQKWQASICGGEIKANGKRRQLYLGVFSDPIAAARAYDAAALKHFGEYASLNFPLESVAPAPAANAAAKEVG